MSCRECVFRGVFQDMGASCDVCNLYPDLADAIAACDNSENCRHRFTIGEAKAIVIEREGSLPAIRERKPKTSEASDPKSINDAFKEIAESACKAVNSIIEAMQALRNVADDK